MNRRNVLSFAGVAIGLGLAGCGGVTTNLPTLPVDVNVNLPPEIKSIVDDASAAIAKVESLGGGIGATVSAEIDKAKGLLAALKGAASSVDVKAIVSGLVSTLGTVAGLLPPPYGTIALAIETLLPIMGGAVGLRMAARRPTGMSPAQARAILRS